MAVSPPFVIDETLPQSGNLLSQYPGQSQPFRDTVESWLTFISDPATGLLKPTAFPSPFILESTDAGATLGPTVDLYRNSASPAVNDLLGALLFNGKNSIGTKTLYGRIITVLDQPASGTETSTIHIQPVASGAVLTDTLLVTATGIFVNSKITIPNGTTITATNIELGGDTLIDLTTALDFHASAGVDFSARIVRGISANGAFQLQQTGTGQFNIINPSGTIMTISGLNTTFAGDVTAASDCRLKDNVYEIDGAKALNMVRNLDGVTFNWKADGSPSIGFIAQSVARWFPELLQQHLDDKYYSLNYNGMIAVLWAAVQALDAEMHRDTEIDV